MIKVKICCINSIEEARLAIDLGASALGLVAEMPSGPGVISEDLIAEITAFVPQGVDTFLLTSHTDPVAIIDQHRRARVTTIQICDRLSTGAHAELRAALPGVSLVQVVHVNDQASVAEALAAASQVDALLLDSGNQGLPVKELGGTGRTHDWQLSRQIVKASPVPVFLAGGLKPDNVSQAIRAVRPGGVDLCTGVRTGGNLDRDKLADFMKAVANA